MASCTTKTADGHRYEYSSFCSDLKSDMTEIYNNSFKWQKMHEKIFSSETAEPFEDLLLWFYNILTTSFEINEKQEITGSVKPLVYIYYQMCHFQ